MTGGTPCPGDLPRLVGLLRGGWLQRGADPPPSRAGWDIHALVRQAALDVEVDSITYRDGPRGATVQLQRCCSWAEEDACASRLRARLPGWTVRGCLGGRLVCRRPR